MARFGHVLIENDERRETISQNVYAGSYTHPLQTSTNTFTYNYYLSDV